MVISSGISLISCIVPGGYGKYAWKDGARCRVRTCDPIRVKDVLYH
jgi:hypothetical protein